MGQTVSSLPVGTTIQLKVNGTPKDFLIIHQGFPASSYGESCNGTWILDVTSALYGPYAWDQYTVSDYSGSTSYYNADLDYQLNYYIRDRFTNYVKSKGLRTVRYPYQIGSHEYFDVPNMKARYAFILSDAEVGFTQADANSYKSVLDKGIMRSEKKSKFPMYHDLLTCGPHL